MFQRTRFKIIVYIILLAIATSILVWWFLFNNARARDYERLADLKVLTGELENYFFKFNTYAIPGCSVGAVINECSGDNVHKFIANKLVDPINRDNYRYIVGNLTNDNFNIIFSLEAGVGGLVRGNYTISKDGISILK